MGGAAPPALHLQCVTRGVQEAPSVAAAGLMRGETSHCGDMHVEGVGRWSAQLSGAGAKQMVAVLMGKSFYATCM